MKRVENWGACVAMIAALAIGFAGTAQATPGANETVLEVKKDCGSPAPDNCFTSFSSAANWITASGSPSATKRFVVNIGPGSWAERWQCASTGYITFRGAGRENTRITGDGTINPTIKATACVDLEFRDLTIQHESKAVSWSREGNSTWTDVDLVSLGTGGTSTGSWAWFDDYCYGSGLQTELPVHYFYSSNLTAHNGTGLGFAGIGDTAFYGGCSDVWFYGGELTYMSHEGSVSGDAAVITAANSKFRAYGSLVRAVVDGSGSELKGSLVAVEASTLNPNSGSSFANDPGVFHMHGGIINVTVGASTTLSTSGPGAIAPDATAAYGKADGTLIHTLDTAYVMNTPAALASYRTYTSGTAKVNAPLLWQSGVYPPMASSEANKLILEDGKDMWVETDCGSDGDCDGGGDEAHLMVSNVSLCTDADDPWLDTVTARCRNDVADSVESRLADLEARVTALE